MYKFVILILAALMPLSACSAVPETQARDLRERPPQDEVIYFVLPDRFANGDASNDTGGIEGDQLAHGHDPTHKGFYHGGDLKGLTQKLDYIEGMGVTAVWFAPIFENKPVQGPAGNESAGYHGYWVTDFTSIDPHFGTNEEFKEFVDAAHARGMKVYMDIITNHTADVIQYSDGDYSYRSLADYPYSTRGGPDDEPINNGFQGDDLQTKENFANLTSHDFAYQAYVPEREKDVKVPSWLNDPIYYHNRGSTSFSGESSRYGDFAGLDDLYTEHPRVLEGMIEIYANWIERFGIDGFRIDTAKHVNPEFWQSFVPAVLETAEAEGIPNFLIFGEVYSASPNSGYIIDSLGWALYRLGRFEEAVPHMERAVELMPVDPVVNDHLGDVYWAVGRTREAEFQWTRALSFVEFSESGEDADPDRIRRKLEVGLDAVLQEEGAAPVEVAQD